MHIIGLDRRIVTTVPSIGPCIGIVQRVMILLFARDDLADLDIAADSDIVADLGMVADLVDTVVGLGMAAHLEVAVDRNKNKSKIYLQIQFVLVF